MNGIDIVVLIIVLFAIIMGLKNGVVIELCGIVGIILGIYIANAFSDNLAHYISVPHEVGVIIAFVVIFILSVIAVVVAAHIISKILSFSGLGTVNRLLGAVASLFKVMLIVAMLLPSIVALSENNGLMDRKYSSSSKTLPILRNISHTLFPHIDFIENYYEKIKNSII